MKYTAIVNGKTYEVEIERTGYGRTISHAAPAPVAAPAPAAAPAPVAAPAPAAAPAPVAAPAGGAAVVSPMPGSILEVMVKPGDTVANGQTVIMLEAMKMEIEVKAECAGTVSDVRVKKGDTVDSGNLLVCL